MSETSALVRMIAKDEQTADRIQCYMDGDTRPDFEGEDPAGEMTVFKASEFTETPVSVSRKDGRTVEAWFENVELKELEPLVATFDPFKPEGRFVFFQDDEEFKGYFVYRGKKLKRLYTIEDDATLDEQLWELGWDSRALDLILARLIK